MISKIGHQLSHHSERIDNSYMFELSCLARIYPIQFRLKALSSPDMLDQHFPTWLLLKTYIYTILRWSLQGNITTYPLCTARNIVANNNCSISLISRKRKILSCSSHCATYGLSSLRHSKWHTTYRTLMGLRCGLNCSQTWFTELVFAWQLFRVCKVIEANGTSLWWIIIILVVSRWFGWCSACRSMPPWRTWSSIWG